MGHDTDVAPISRDHCETVLAHLLLEGYLKEDFHFTPYNTISYLLPGDRSAAVDESTVIDVRVDWATEAGATQRKPRASKTEEDGRR